MLRHLEADRARVAELEARILDLERSIAELRAEKAIAQERLNSYKYPVLTLPNEIISEIFVHFLPSYPICPPLVGPLSPTSLIQICRKWRAVTLATPTLWRAIEFCYYFDHESYTPDWRCPTFQIGDAWLGRSGSCPLSMSIDTFRVGYALLSAIVPHRARWEHLKLSIDPSSLPRLFDGPAPLLRHLDLLLSNCQPIELHAVDLPQLRSVMIRVFDEPMAGAVESIPLPWAQLTSLVLWAVPSSVMVSILHQAPSLVHCVLGFPPKHELSSFGGEHITLPCLETLGLETLVSETFGLIAREDFLLNLSVPALRRLEFNEGTLGSNPIGSLTAFISMSANLQEIKITAYQTSIGPTTLQNTKEMISIPNTSPTTIIRIEISLAL
ncbi:F-box domain-containing protein [Mycena sanguinolenta]|uniref:F-box domain-containing protein n=1 Tax=Mycena sanguinolenta TaxID=230812 RepID=A0A8H6YXB9_9AGAR|nr:F-box domain-containing protein [Mycena sanguinolenta]